MMKTAALTVFAALALAGCGDGSQTGAANDTQAPASVDAVTTEAVSDTQAAEADAMKAADAELDGLDDSIDDRAAGNRVGNSTAVVAY